MRWVLHVDLDEFLAAVEILRDPALAGKPVVVGGRGDPTERGVVSTASYRAREYGVRSGMPLRIAARKCPDAVFLPVDKPLYEEASAQVMETLRSSGLPVEVLGWDEAFVGADTDDPQELADRLRAAVLAATPAQRLADEIGPTMGPWLRRLGRGADSAPVDPTPYIPRGHGRETTFQHNLTDPAQVAEEARRLALQVLADVRAEGRAAVRVGMKLRYAPFETRTRSLTLPEPTLEEDRVVAAALELLGRFDGARPVRLLGVRLEMEPAAR